MGAIGVGFIVLFLGDLWVFILMIYVYRDGWAAD